MKILFVCEENICRSPMCEIILKNLVAHSHDPRAKKILVASAGTFADGGTPMSPHCETALRACNEFVPVDLPISRQLTWEMVNIADHIFCMTDLQRMQIDPNGHLKHKVHTLATDDVPDPWFFGEGAYIAVCKHLQTHVRSLYDEICKTL